MHWRCFSRNTAETNDVFRMRVCIAMRSGRSSVQSAHVLVVINQISRLRKAAVIAWVIGVASGIAIVDILKTCGCKSRQLVSRSLTAKGNVMARLHCPLMWLLCLTHTRAHIKCLADMLFESWCGMETWSWKVNARQNHVKCSSGTFLERSVSYPGLECEHRSAFAVRNSSVLITVRSSSIWRNVKSNVIYIRIRFL